MREIKFRAWNLKRKEMNTNQRNVLGNMASYGDEGKYEGHIVMQYTGLKDKKGKEIYEGDILKGKSWMGDCKGVVRFSPAQGYRTIMQGTSQQSYLPEERRTYPLVGQTVGASRFKTFEVIGNIYENPELLLEVKTK